MDFGVGALLVRLGVARGYNVEWGDGRCQTGAGYFRKAPRSVAHGVINRGSAPRREVEPAGKGSRLKC
jgi:hypothetical protein